MRKRVKFAAVSGGVLLSAISSAQAQLYSTGFEQPAITTGSIAGQDGWYINGAPNYEGVVNAASTSPTGNAASNNNPLSGNQSYRFKGSDFAEHLIGTTSEGMTFGYTQQLDPPSTPGGGDGGLYSSLSMNNSDGLTYAQVIFGEKAYYGSNQINLLTGSTETPVATFTDAQAHDAWRLDLNFNYVAQTYSVTYADLTTGDAPITSSAVAFNLPAAPGGAGGLPSSDDVFDIRVRFGGLIDNVGAVPEPASLMLFALGAPAMLLRRRRTR